MNAIYLRRCRRMSPADILRAAHRMRRGTCCAATARLLREVGQRAKATARPSSTCACDRVVFADEAAETAHLLSWRSP